MTIQKIKNANNYMQGSMVTSADKKGNYARVNPDINVLVEAPRDYIFGQEDSKFIKLAVTNAAPTVLAGTAGRKIRVISYVLGSDATLTVKWQSNTTDLSGAIPLVANSIISANSDGNQGLVETNVGETLKLLPSGAGNVTGHITYIIM